MGTFLVVQWLGLHALTAQSPGLIPGQGTRSHMHVATKSPGRSEDPGSHNTQCNIQWTVYLAIKWNESESVVVSWMNQECVKWSEVSQKEKNKYSTLKT